MAQQDNAKLIRSLLNFDTPEEFYLVQIIRRASDDPLKKFGKEDPRYHGTEQTTLSYFYITSLEDFDRKLPDIYAMADALGARAYINLNKRNFRKTEFKLLELIAANAASNTFRRPDRLLGSAVGRAKPPKEETLWLIDVDEEYLPYEAWIREKLEYVEPYQKESDLITIPSATGKHILCKPFNIEAMGEMWDLQSLEKPKMFDVHPDGATLLYRPNMEDR